VGTSAKVMQANSKMAEVMGETTKAMGQMNKAVNPAKLNQTLQEFSKQSAKMDMTDEMSE
jgi:charged multivesicular body protein 2B